ncbi:MAG: glycosyltransferase [Duncaniella sp.]|uniref:glycosyltransferase n=1 Tax=Duncaniella sp. TaxID=2518496 RepID=UPI0023BEB418|nr:glycosyltransferase [Duncaniella sp.]MDE6091305.1 glycosyltransferase [Duncaniella sp.]
MKNKKILVLGYFGYQTNQLDGQTVKTRDIYRLVKEQFPNNKINYFDTQEFKFNKLSIFKMLWMVCRCNRLIYLPANNNLKYIFPLIFVLSRIFRFRIDYFVVGGWLSQYLKNMPVHTWMLKHIAGIHVETKRLKSDLEKVNCLANVDIFPNFRFFDFTPKPSNTEKLRCVFMARIIKKKGLDWIFNLADYIESHQMSDKISITFYGQINEPDSDYFLSSIDKYDFITFGGSLQPDEIHKTLNNYDVLLLPTHFYTEGLPWSIVDAYISGIPVIATEWLNAKEFIDDSITGFIIPFENGQNALIEKVILLQQNRELLNEMKSNTLIKRNEFTLPSYMVDNLRLVFVSRLCVEKGLDTLCRINEQILQEFDNKITFTIDFYGQKTDSYFDNQIENKYENFKYKGILAPDKVIKVISDYDALIFPTHYDGEGCPGILIEALAAELPVIASDWKDNSEFIHNKENGFLCEPLNINDYIEAIVSLSRNKNLRRQMSLHSHVLSENYSNAFAGRRLTEIIK